MTAAVDGSGDEESEIARRKAVVAAGGTDRERWCDPASYEAFWSDRSVAAGQMLPPGLRVCDIGCGMQGLRAHLPAGSIYLPADLRAWTPEVLPCDLNAGLLPERYLAICDVVCLLGVIEYLYDLPAFFTALRRRTETVLVSYNCVDFAAVDRAGYGWVNALGSEQLLALLRDHGFEIAEVRRVGRMEILVRATQPRFGWLRRLRRDLRRRLS
ncbi:class I SAM-dependent methyltransferase [Roseomonas sp. ACRSG]|nr:class I SAM-dependent methyltransferase [Roseomonas sp. ACRSG]